MSKKIGKCLIMLLGVLAVAAFPVLFMFFQNAAEVRFNEVSGVMLRFLAVGAVLYGLCLAILRKPAKAGLVAMLFMLVFSNYRLIENLLMGLSPELRYWHVVGIVIFIALHIAWAICKFVPDDISDTIAPILGAVFIVLIVVNGVTAVPKINSRLKNEREAAQIRAQSSAAGEDMPNFYFILFDEYSSLPFMQKYYDYDNSALTDKLARLGFVSSQTGHNESSWTRRVTANLFQLDYVFNSDQYSSEEYLEKRINNPVFAKFREKGYDLVSPAGGWMYGLDDALQNEKKASTVSGEDIESVILSNTIVYPFVTRYSTKDTQIIQEQMDYLKNSQNFPAHNQFTIAHIICPHEPFRFDSDGNTLSNISSDWSNKSLYLHQYQYISSEIYRIAENIVRNDPESVIWILSDHSARASSNAELAATMFTDEDKTSFFSVVYFQGKPIDIEGLSGVNTFRTILNKLFGTDYEMVSMPDESEAAS